MNMGNVEKIAQQGFEEFTSRIVFQVVGRRPMLAKPTAFKSLESAWGAPRI